MTRAAESPLSNLGHVHFVGFFSHLEYMIMTTATLEPLCFYMQFMAEKYFANAPRGKSQIPASQSLRRGANRCNK